MESFLDCVVSNVALSGALAVVALSLTRVWRSPQLAHALWFLVLIKLVTPPVVRLPLPEALMPTGLPPAIEWSVVTGDKLKVAIADRAGIQTASPPRPASLASEHALGIRAAPAMSVESTTLPTAAAPVLAVGVEKTASFLVAGWRMWLCLVWAGGVLVYAALLWRWIVRFRTLMSEAVSADSDLIEDGHSFAKLLGLRHCPPIHVLDAQLPPLVCAAWRGPFVLVPRRMLMELDRGQRQAVLVHELAHIRRRDHLVRWFEIFVCGLFWWNPLAWWARRQLQFAEEECCDAWVVWALPDGQRSYGKALLWAVDFRAERRAVPAVAGTAFGGPHIKRRIEMVMKRKLNRKMSWSALLLVALSAVCVLPVAAQKRLAADAGDRGLVEREPKHETVTQAPKPIAESRDLEARIERLERQLQELNHTVAGSAANAGSNGWSKRNPMLQQSAVNLGDDKNKQLSETLVALDKQAWDAAAIRDWKAYEKLLRPGYYWGYFGSSRNAPTVAGLQCRRYFDVNIREVDVGKITEDVAFLKYVYNCKVEEAGQVQNYRDRQSMQIWTRIDGNWVITYTTNFVLMGGE